MYYCTHFVYESGQNLCPPTDPPLTYYASVHLCCKEDSELGTALIYRTFATEPPKTFPQGCRAALHEAAIGQYVCKSGEDAYSNWDATFADMLTAHIGPNGQQPQPGGMASQQGTSELQPFWPWPPHWANAGTGGSRRTAYVNAGCRDLNVPGRPSDCPTNAHRCTDPKWVSLMAAECPMTCGYCSSSQMLTKTGGTVARQQIANTNGCGDLIPPLGSGQPNCPTKVELGLCRSQQAQMGTECPLSCGFC
ncbi:hypothetical protein niasHT_037656 [Heterodera trifolii]|uniref:ShKT domain-containing protein n=1 Tax=Heterodera trifolii TaxID=157864 RepID=A0ABD2IK72_9BILA